MKVKRQKYLLKILTKNTPDSILRLYESRDEPGPYVNDVRPSEVNYDKHYKYGYPNINQTKTNKFSTKIKFWRKGKNHTHSITSIYAKQVHILRERFKQNNIKSWYLSNRDRQQFFQTDSTFEKVIKSINKGMIKKWSQVKTIVQHRIHNKQIETWINDSWTHT